MAPLALRPALTATALGTCVLGAALLFSTPGAADRKAPAVPASPEVLASGDAAILPPLPASCLEVSSVRLVPAGGALQAGACRVLDFQARCKATGQWHSILQRKDVTLRVAAPARGVTLLPESRSVVCVPEALEPKSAGRTVSIVASFARPGRKPLTARARIKLVQAKSAAE